MAYLRVATPRPDATAGEAGLLRRS